MSVSPPVRENENESRISFEYSSFVLSFHLEHSAIQVILEGGQFIHFQSK